MLVWNCLCALPKIFQVQRIRLRLRTKLCAAEATSNSASSSLSALGQILKRQLSCRKAGRIFRRPAAYSDSSRKRARSIETIYLNMGVSLQTNSKQHYGMVVFLFLSSRTYLRAGTFNCFRTSGYGSKPNPRKHHRQKEPWTETALALPSEFHVHVDTPTGHSWHIIITITTTHTTTSNDSDNDNISSSSASSSIINNIITPCCQLLYRPLRAIALWGPSPARSERRRGSHRSLQSLRGWQRPADSKKPAVSFHLYLKISF